jgi:DNA-binding SARP family transcriptional activator
MEGTVHSVNGQKPATQQPIKLSLLGGFHIDRANSPVALPAPSERLVASLAVNRCARHRSQLAGTLWPEKSESRALANVRAALWQINKRCEGLVVPSGGGLAIGPGVEVDLWRSLDWCESILGSGGGPAAQPGGDGTSDLGPLAGPVQLDLLPSWSDEWLVFTRQYHRLQWLQAIDELGARMLEAEDYGGSLRAGLSAIGADYFHERGHELVIASLIGGGNRVEALRHYEVFKDVMAAEMSLEPSDRVKRLVAAVDRSAVSV